MNLIDFKKCNDYSVYDRYLTPRMMCAGDLRGGRDSCQVGLFVAQGPGPWGWGKAGVLGLVWESGPPPFPALEGLPHLANMLTVPCRETAGGLLSASRTTAGI